MNPITTTPFLSAADEAFAQRLEANEDEAWRGLLGSVPPVFSNPVAEQIADLLVMKSSGEYQDDMGKFIRRMLYTKAALSSEREERPEDDDDDTMDVEEADDDTMSVEEADDDTMSVDERDDGRWPVDPEQDYGGDFPPEEYSPTDEDDDTMDVEEDDGEDWGSAGGPPLPGRRLIDGEWKSVPYAEWTDADKALAEEIYGHDSEDEEERAYEEWLAKRDRWLQKQSKETLIEMVLMDDLEKELYINKQVDDSDAE
jgi:hypothetical protein